LILVDSDVLIANLRGVEAARQWLVRARTETGPLATSTVSITEVAGGMRSPERREVSRLLASLRPFSVSERIAWSAAELMRIYRRSHPGIGLGDYLIAATAQVEGLELATLNVRHFPMFEGLEPPFRV
jgi:predicted nucleic acid-binding protein